MAGVYIKCGKRVPTASPLQLGLRSRSGVLGDQSYKGRGNYGIAVEADELEFILVSHSTCQDCSIISTNFGKTLTKPMVQIMRVDFEVYCLLGFKEADGVDIRSDGEDAKRVGVLR